MNTKQQNTLSRLADLPPAKEHQSALDFLRQFSLRLKVVQDDIIESCARIASYVAMNCITWETVEKELFGQMDRFTIERIANGALLPQFAFREPSVKRAMTMLGPTVQKKIVEDGGIKVYSKKPREQAVTEKFIPLQKLRIGDIPLKGNRLMSKDEQLLAAQAATLARPTVKTLPYNLAAKMFKMLDGHLTFTLGMSTYVVPDDLVEMWHGAILRARVVSGK